MKRLHPDSKVLFGGFSSSYFHEELITYPQVDLVIRGDSAEEPIAALMLGGVFIAQEEKE